MDPTKAKLFLLPIKIDFWMVRSKEIKTTAFFYPILLHWLNIISWLLYFALLKQYRVMVGCSPFITVPLCCYLLLTLFSCMGLLLWWQSFSGNTCSTMVSCVDCGRMSPLVPGAPPLPPSLTLVFTELFIRLFSPQYSLCLCSLFLFLTYTFTEALPAWLMEPAGISCIQHRAAPASPYICHPSSPPTTDNLVPTSNTKNKISVTKMWYV